MNCIHFRRKEGVESDEEEEDEEIDTGKSDTSDSEEDEEKVKPRETKMDIDKEVDHTKRTLDSETDKKFNGIQQKSFSWFNKL